MKLPVSPEIQSALPVPLPPCSMNQKQVLTASLSNQAGIPSPHRSSLSNLPGPAVPATKRMKLVEKVFANEMRMTMPFNSPSFTISNPCSVRSLLDHHDSGLFVIRSMQHYLNQWYEGFNSADQRVRLALEIVRNPKNEVIDRVLFAAALDEAAQQPPEGKLQNDGREVQLDCQPMFTQGIKFTARRPRH
ncbi:hypothetical protein M0R45_019682 [Rubus argutus]|uniref:Uncharacterized protein n=1 Tax=Rubus argutus TaxID=59490 RepID=A0AAW1X8J1_RUBAR